MQIDESDDQRRKHLHRSTYANFLHLEKMKFAHIYFCIKESKTHAIYEFDDSTIEGILLSLDFLLKGCLNHDAAFTSTVEKLVILNSYSSCVIWMRNCQEIVARQQE
uniref:Uncharacterized protein n=1 Tax=Romanomermis culicivorax TaxID=13658 RepID=A0A915JJU4_ROMCU